MTSVSGSTRGASRCGSVTVAAALLATALTAAGCGGDFPRSRDQWGLCPRLSGNICTVAGTGIAGDGADLQLAWQTRLYLPQDMTLGPDGRLYVADWNNHRVRAIDPDGRMSIVAGSGELGPAADDPSTDRLNHPTSIAFNPFAPPGQMTIAAWHNSRVKTVDLGTGDIVDVCGNGKRGFAGNGGPAATATLDLPVAVAFDPVGDMLIADQANQMIRKIDHATGLISTIAGTGHCADAINPAPCVLGDGGPATAGGFHFPIGQAASPGGRIALDPQGNIYVADTENFRVRLIDTAGIISTFAGNGTWGAAGDGGPAVDGMLGRLSDVAVGPDGSVYIADTDNSCVRVVTPDGVLSTFAGRCATRGATGDNGPAAAALLDRPYGVEVTASGDVFIADTHNQRVRIVFH